MRAIGYVSLAIGAMWLLYVFNLDTSVPIGLTGQRVQNLSLMEQRQTHLVLAMVSILVGVLLLVVASLRDSRALDSGSDEDDEYHSCPHCAEPIRVKAVYCRHCKRHIAALVTESTGAGEIEDSAGLADADSEPDPDAHVRHLYRDLRDAAEAAESRIAADRVAE